MRFRDVALRHQPADQFRVDSLGLDTLHFAGEIEIGGAELPIDADQFLVPTVFALAWDCRIDRRNLRRASFRPSAFWSLNSYMRRLNVFQAARLFSGSRRPGTGCRGSGRPSTAGRSCRLGRGTAAGACAEMEKFRFSPGCRPTSTCSAPALRLGYWSAGRRCCPARSAP